MQKYCPSCQATIGEQSSQCETCGEPILIDAEIVNPYAAPVASQLEPTASSASGDDQDPLNVVIPYKNPKALFAYYLGIASGLPFIGFPIGIAAFVLGVMGLKEKKRKPEIRGSAHAWIGIGCGGIFTLLWGLLGIAIIIGLIAQAN